MNSIPCPELNVCGYPFRFIQKLIPDCQDGVVVTYRPQNRYVNRKNLSLLENGDGAFCHFRIDAPPSPGVYLWVVNKEILYIGETQDFVHRFNVGYGNISPRNCYVGGQSTNCKMNKVVMEYYEKHTPIELYFFETNRHKQVESELLDCYNTKYNKKDN